MFPFDPPENIRKPLVLGCFQGDQKGTSGRYGLSNDDLVKNIVKRLPLLRDDNFRKFSLSGTIYLFIYLFIFMRQLCCVL